MVNGELALLVYREGRVVEALHRRPGFFDITHMPFANMNGVVTTLGKHFSQGDFLLGEAKSRNIYGRVTHPIAEGLATGHECHPRGRTGGLGVHAGQAHAFTCKFINAGSFIAANCIQSFAAEIAKTDVIDQNVKDIG